jgi:FKBP-type peptidyl-prolyl cis-trans isomerase SlyD
MQIGLDSVVSFNYALTGEDGQTLDKSDGEPLVYLHGRGGLVPGLESEMEGKQAGDSFSCDVAPEDGYGAYARVGPGGAD